MFFDTHCHLSDERLRSSEILENARQNGVSQLLSVACHVDDAREILRFADGREVFATAGFHPAYALGWRDDSLAELEKLADDPRVVAIGEIGLDYVYDDANADFPGAPRAFQEAVFEAQLDLAARKKLPIVIHNRDATPRILEIVKLWHESLVGGVFHCFGAGADVAKQVLDLGFHLGFGGLVTFKNAPLAVESARFCPIEWMLLETDAPYLAPVPHRGKTNQPAFVPLVAQKIAELQGAKVEQIGQTTTENASRLFLRAR